MFATFLSEVCHVDSAMGHDHREYSFPLPLRDVAAIVRPAVGAIEVYCQDALPWSEINHENRSWVWEHSSKEPAEEKARTVAGFSRALGN
jgi:hypothetical protein